MFFNVPLSGLLLPEKTLCFSYDDGPWISGSGAGTHSLKLAEYLAEQGVFATFFVLGEHAKVNEKIVVEIQDLGHLIGSHSFSHTNLPKVERTEDVIRDVQENARIIREVCGSDRILFRPPYGSWWNGTTISHLPSILNGALCCNNQIGPILWDIDGRDWEYWAKDLSPKKCAQAYIDLIEKKKKGIILMHDSLANPKLREKVRALELAQELVPKLKKSGYKFIRVDRIPQIQSAMNVSRKISIRAENGLFLKARGIASENFELTSSQDFSNLCEFGFIPLNNENYAIRAPGGNYISLKRGHIKASAFEITHDEIFKVKALPSGLYELMDSQETRKLSVELSEVDGKKIAYMDKFYIQEIK
jgi:peptidoglycan/xylan/chitin deacetylase (PgdA/CDA1 family)